MVSARRYAALLLALPLACAGDDGEASASDTDATSAAMTASASASASASTSGDGSTAGSDADASSGASDSTGGATGTTSAGDDSIQQRCVDAINEYRATLDLPPYARWTDAEACADDEAESDAATNTPHGAFGSCDEFAQNECPGWPGDDPEGSLLGCLSQMWAEGPGEDFQKHGHYINMSSTKYTQVACGFYTTGSGDLWALQNFR